MSVFRGSFELYSGETMAVELSTRLESLGFQCAFVLVDEGVKGNEGLEVLSQLLDMAKIKHSWTFASFAGEPTYSDLDRLTAQLLAAEAPDLLVGVGGGSAMDMVKGLAATVPAKQTNSILYRGMNKVIHSNLTTLVVPTTAGSGSEMTYTASLIDSDAQTKLGINGDNMFPTFGAHIPKLLVSAPDSVIIGSALDVLVHAVEAITSAMNSRYSDALATQAIDLVLEFLPKFIISKREGRSPTEEAQQLLTAASLAGLAMLNSSGGFASAISYPLGAIHSVPHGFAGGISLPFVLRAEERAGLNRIAKLGLDASLSSRLFRMYEVLGVPKDFAAWNVSTEHIDDLFGRTIDEKSGSLALSPLGLDMVLLRQILEEVIKS